MVDPQDIGTIAIGGTALTTFIVWAFRKSWQQIIGTKVDNASSANDQAKLTADKQLFDNLREEVTRQGLELRQVKLDAKQEKLELEERITELEAKIMRLTFHLGSIRKHALDAYAKLISRECKEHCPAVDRALEHLKSIIEEE